MQQLTQTERQHLRKLAHDLRPVLQIGKQGLTPNALSSIENALAARELIKLKFLDFQDEKQSLSEQIATELGAALIGIVGNVAIFYRQQPDPDRRRIELP